MSRYEDDDDEVVGTGTPLPEGFVNQEAVARALSMEQSMHPEESQEDLTFRLLRENAPRVTMQIVNLALNGSNEKIRLDAGKYVVDRVLGPMGKEVRADSPLEKMIREMNSDVEAYANERSE